MTDVIEGICLIEAILLTDFLFLASRSTASTNLEISQLTLTVTRHLGCLVNKSFLTLVNCCFLNSASKTLSVTNLIIENIVKGFHDGILFSRPFPLLMRMVFLV